MNMKARAFPPNDAHDVDFHHVKSKTKVKSKKTRFAMWVKRKIDIACLQEAKWYGQKTQLLVDGFKLYYNGFVNKRNGVVYTPQSGCKDEERILEKAMMEIPKDNIVIIGGDLNAHVGMTREGYKYHGYFRYREVNEGEDV
ncbi:uncharacterized protein LOC135926782 [Gordionus sp. m RMFG-2023]|uniref:uncharacterized protein LOC135926782 n=1 Tax=Gordionus sp. m RMFG-2023 TaxID=3053472 RepID=UPI0031FD3C33